MYRVYIACVLDVIPLSMADCTFIPYQLRTKQKSPFKEIFLISLQRVKLIN